jgi:hypothetical protein
MPDGKRSQGGVKFPTGGNGGFFERGPHEPASACGLQWAAGSADFGAIPKPTVTVRMKESAKCGSARALSIGARGLACGFVRPDSGNLLSRGTP